jgi:ribonuclease D
MTLEYIDTAAAAANAADAISREPSLALDCEAAGFHRYSDRLCLVQISTPGGRDLIFDPLEVELAPLLGPLIEDPGRRLYMHGGDYDVRLLDRDLQLRPRGIFDTQIAASLLGLDSLGLAALLEEHFGVRLSKKYQRADWAQRPLDDGMLEYAAADTRYLHELAGILGEQLERAGRTAWAEEEFGYMEAIRHEPDEGGDPVTRVKRARKLGPREVTRLREALAWRDAIAREQDRAPFRVASDAVLIDAAISPPLSAQELADRKGMNGRIARRYGRDLVERLRRVDALPDGELVPYPRVRGTGPGRPTPEEEELVIRLKEARNQVAGQLGIDRGVLFPNASILDVVRRSPSSVAEMTEMEGIRRWQSEVLGDALLDALG